MKTIYTTICLLLLTGLSCPALAQPFFGYQTIGVHSWYFSLSWDGTQPSIGVGYNRRVDAGSFSDVGAEWRAPIAKLYEFTDQEIIFGAYGPFALNRRPFMGGGLHLRVKTTRPEATMNTKVSLAATLLPSYTYAASLNNGPYGTAGLRATYLLTLLKKSGDAPAMWVPSFGTELGGHLDLHLERTLGMSLNGFFSREWAIGQPMGLTDADTRWTGKGDYYFGSTYWLRRW